MDNEKENTGRSFIFNNFQIAKNIVGYCILTQVFMLTSDLPMGFRVNFIHFQNTPVGKIWYWLNT